MDIIEDVTWCAQCNLSFTDKKEFRNHKKGQAHYQMLEESRMQNQKDFEESRQPREISNEQHYGTAQYMNEQHYEQSKQAGHSLTNEPQNSRDAFCDLCKINFDTLASYESHLKSALHQRNVSRQQETEPQEEEQKDVQPDEDRTKCAICNMNFYKETQYWIHVRGISHYQRLEKAKGMQEGGNQQAYCDLCDMTFDTSKLFKDHLVDEVHKRNASQKHIKQIEAAEKEKEKETFVWRPGTEDAVLEAAEEEGYVKTFRCEICDVKCPSLMVFRTHLDGQKHKKKLKVFQSKLDLLNKANDSVKVSKECSVSELEQAVSKEPLIGLDYMVEYKLKNATPSERAATVICYLCNSKMDVRQVVPHTLGLRHQVKYFKHHSQWRYEKLWPITSKAKKKALAKNYASIIDETEGRHRVRVRVEVDVLSSNLKHTDMYTVGEKHFEELPDEHNRPFKDLPGIKRSETFDNFSHALPDSDDEDLRVRPVRQEMHRGFPPPLMSLFPGPRAGPEFHRQHGDIRAGVPLGAPSPYWPRYPQPLLDRYYEPGGPPVYPPRPLPDYPYPYRLPEVHARPGDERVARPSPYHQVSEPELYGQSRSPSQGMPESYRRSRSPNQGMHEFYRRSSPSLGRPEYYDRSRSPTRGMPESSGRYRSPSRRMPESHRRSRSSSKDIADIDGQPLSQSDSSSEPDPYRRSRSPVRSSYQSRNHDDYRYNRYKDNVEPHMRPLLPTPGQPVYFRPRGVDHLYQSTQSTSNDESHVILGKPVLYRTNNQRTGELKKDMGTGQSCISQILVNVQDQAEQLLQHIQESNSEEFPSRYTRGSYEQKRQNSLAVEQAHQEKYEIAAKETQKVINTLGSCNIENENDARFALQISQSLTTALAAYRMRQLTKSEIPKSAESAKSIANLAKAVSFKIKSSTQSQKTSASQPQVESWQLEHMQHLSDLQEAQNSQPFNAYEQRMNTMLTHGTQQIASFTKTFMSSPFAMPSAVPPPLPSAPPPEKPPEPKPTFPFPAPVPKWAKKKPRY